MTRIVHSPESGVQSLTGADSPWPRWWELARGMISYGHSLSDAEVVGHVRRMQSPEENRCGYAAFENALKLPFALHELKRRKLTMPSKEAVAA